MNDLKRATELIWKTYKDEIIESGDWFFNLEEQTLNFHDQDRDGLMTVDIYQATNNQTNWDKLEPFKMYFKYAGAIA